jgi:hypothetical protein
MALSRRQFFQRFLGPQKSPKERLARYEEIKGWVRTYLYPYDFGVTPEQNAELFAKVQAVLENTPDETLFSDIVRLHIEELAEENFQVWRSQWLGQTHQTRDSAVEYVSSFLSSEATAEDVEHLKKRFGAGDLQELEQELKKRIQDWVAGIEDERLNRSDIKTLVHTELRSWCLP